jgi:carbohydrate-selective porin OprB
LGFGFSRNGLSSSHRDYLAAGGVTVFLGDGRLNYRAEQIYESYYSIGVSKQLSLSLDWQHIRNPGYNADRGPVQIYSVRLHAQF